MKTCFKCKRELPVSEFYRHPQMGDGHLGKCKDCTKADAQGRYWSDPDAMSEYERKRSAFRERKEKKREYEQKRNAAFPEKKRAQRLVCSALKSGKLTKQPCEVCGKDKVQAHHDDYSKPLDVRWLCFLHHRMLHGQYCDHPDFSKVNNANSR